MELLIAIAVSAVVLAAINAVFYGALRLQSKTVNSIDNALPLQHTLAVLQRDLANLVPPGGTLSGVLQTSRLGNQSSSSANLNQTVFHQPGEGSPDFYTSSGIIDETSPWAEIQRVSYYLIASTNGGAGKDLVRAVTRNLLPALQEQPEPSPLLTGVQGIHFLFHDGTQWRDSWDSAATGTLPLPKAIKVQLSLVATEPGQAQPQPIELVVPLFAQGPTNQVAATAGGAP